MTAARVDVISREPSSVERLCGTVGKSLVELGIRTDCDGERDDLRRLTSESLQRYDEFPQWPSMLTDSGAPLELSVRISAAGDVSVRCVVDVFDHRSAWPGNWASVLRYGSLVASAAGDADPEAVWELCRRHLDGVPAHIPSKVIHGVAYGPSGWRRGSLYFRTGWMPPEVLAQRFREGMRDTSRLEERHRCRVDPHVEVLGYDLVPGRRQRFKSYRWVALDGGSPYDELVGNHPDLRVTSGAFESFRQFVPHEQRERCLFLQSSADGDALRQRLFFFARAWGWTVPERIDALTRLLQEELSIDLGPLFLLARIAESHGMPLKLGMLAVGMEGDAPSATFYLWPVIPPPGDTAPSAGRSEENGHRRGRGVHDSVRAPRVEESAARMCRAGRSHLLATRAPDGSWTDYREGSARTDGDDWFTTAYVVAMTSTQRDRPAAATADWLRAHGALAGGVEGAPAEAVPLSVVAMVRCGLLPAADDEDSLLGALQGREDRAEAGDVEEGPAEADAAALFALVVAFEHRIVPILARALHVVRRQEPGGGWASSGWSSDLYATWWALSGLRTFATTYGEQLAKSGPGRGLRAMATGALERGRRFLASVVVPDDPFLLGLWLGGWASAGGDAGDARVARVVGALERLQRPEGRWLGSPQRRAGGAMARDPREQLSVDESCVVTTATVVGGLETLLSGR